jgi:hypothetical protein
MQVDVISGSGDDEIKNYVSACPNSLIYSYPSFIDLISDHLEACPSWILARNDTGILGALPIVESRPGNHGTVFNSLPYYGSNGGVLQDVQDDQVKRLLIENYFDYAQSRKACSATVITNPLNMDHEIYESTIEGFIWDERIGQITHLPENPEGELLKLFEDPRPRNIRRAVKEGIQVTSGNEKVSVEFLYKVHVENMQAIDGLSKSWGFFEKLLTDMPSEMWSIYIGSKEGEPVSALLLFYFNGTVEYFTPVIKSEYRNTQALALVIYEAMKDAVSHKGCKNWNWGGTWQSQGGVYDFKKRWGTRDYPYYYYTKLFNEKVRSSSKDTLLEDYPGFFVLPFSELEETENE